MKKEDKKPTGVCFRNKYRPITVEIDGEKIETMELIEMTCVYYEDGKCTRTSDARWGCPSVTCDARREDK